MAPWRGDAEMGRRSAGGGVERGGDHDPLQRGGATDAGVEGPGKGTTTARGGWMAPARGAAEASGRRDGAIEGGWGGGLRR